MIKVGISLLRCLHVLEEASGSEEMRGATRKLRAAIENGETLSRAMSAMPQVFDADYVGSVRTGEVGGILDLTMSRWADMLERGVEARESSRGQLAEWCWRFGHLLGARVPFLMALETLAGSVHSPLREITLEMTVRTRVGAPLAEPLLRYVAFLTPMLVQMVATGEETGTLEHMLSEAAAHFDREAALEAEGRLPPLPAPSVERRAEAAVGAEEEDAVVRRVNELIVAALRSRAKGIELSPAAEGKGSARLGEQTTETVTLDDYDRVVRRLRIMADIDPFARDVRTGQVHIRWEGKDFAADITSRPSPAGDRLYLRLAPEVVLEATDQQ
jgi:hypothetical protein